MMLFSLSPEEVQQKVWGSVSPEDKLECELALLKFLNKKNWIMQVTATYLIESFQIIRVMLWGLLCMIWCKRGSSWKLVTGGTSFVKA